MKVLDTYPLITTPDLRAARNFYRSHFGMEIVFEASWVVMLGRRANGRISLGLMSADHPTNPPGPEIFNGKGMIVTVQVEDAAAAFEKLKRSGAPVVYGLHDEPWGQRRFMTRDPGGTLVDVVEQTEPAPGYWEKYLPVEEQI
ncbi:MAG: VOC family protein [Bradyrhizobiaceae bacterium]|nr:VOC family protein [Bradyrhizobiaceae bacterium]